MGCGAEGRKEMVQARRGKMAAGTRTPEGGGGLGMRLYDTTLHNAARTLHEGTSACKNVISSPSSLYSTLLYRWRGPRAGGL